MGVCHSRVIRAPQSAEVEIPEVTVDARRAFHDLPGGLHLQIELGTQIPRSGIIYRYGKRC